MDSSLSNNFANDLSKTSRLSFTLSRFSRVVEKSYFGSSSSDDSDAISP